VIFFSIPPEDHNTVDEIMVNFKGRSPIKQYIRGKPNPWGFKLWGRAGILYDFDVDQGASKCSQIIISHPSSCQ